MTTWFAWVLLAANPASAQDMRAVAGQWADYWAVEYRVPPELVRAVIEIESAWRPLAVSDKGAAGLMQLMPETAARFGVTNRFDIGENTRGGVAFLATLLKMFGNDWRLALAGYYTGERRIQPRGLAFSDPDVYRYVNEVGRVYWRLCRESREQSGGTNAKQAVVGVRDVDGR